MMSVYFQFTKTLHDEHNHSPPQYMINDVSRQQGNNELAPYSCLISSCIIVPVSARSPPPTPQRQGEPSVYSEELACWKILLFFQKVALWSP